MSRNTEYQFVSTDTDTIVSSLVTAYESLTNTVVQPASPERLFLQWVANVIVLERTYNNYTGNQNLPSRAEGENLDLLGELFCAGTRPTAQAAVATVRFTVSEAQPSAILIPAGTRVTDSDNTLYWATVKDVYIAIGDTYVDTQVQCVETGAQGNGYAIGQLNTIVDLYDYYQSVSNITVSDGGSDAADDDEYYALMKASMDGFSCAGSVGGYIYFAQQVSTEIGDVAAISHNPGEVTIYVLMATGAPATSEIKSAVLAACSENEVRPMTDLVSIADPNQVEYDIDITYYISNSANQSASEIEANIIAAVENYVTWQSAKLGRDINPDKLREYLLAAGVKRVELVSPAFTVLSGGDKDTVPQVAVLRNTSIISGGYEDE